MNIYQHSVLSIPDVQTGEVSLYKQTSPGVFQKAPDPLEIAAARWRMKYAVRTILGPTARPSKCHRWRLPNRQVEVQRSLQHDSTFFSGLERCSSVWLCPLCASKISERRVHELQAALDFAKEHQLWPQLLTLTFPHGMGQQLSTIKSSSLMLCDPSQVLVPHRKVYKKNGILDLMLESFNYMLSGSSGRFLRSKIPWVGLIRSLEVTYGFNGWHPHLHILVFSLSGLPLSKQQAYWSSAWIKACKKKGLPLPSGKHGCTLQNGHHASKYVAKWGIAQEMTKSHIKSGKDKGASPWDLLRLASGDIWPNMPPIAAGPASALWHEYAHAFKGRRQLVWSRCLKSMMGIDDLTDEQIVEKEDDTASVLYLISPEEWSWILAARAEVQILSVARDCPDALPDFIRSLMTNENFVSDDPELISRFNHIKGSAAYCPF